MVNTEFAFEPASRRAFPRQFENERVHDQIDALDILDCQLSLAAQLDAPIDARMYDDAAGEWLVRVRRDLEALSKRVLDLAPIVLLRKRLQESARRLECTLGRRVPV